MGLLTNIRTRLKAALAAREGRTASAQFVVPPRADHALIVGTTSARFIPRWRQFRYSGLVFSGAEQRLIIIAAFFFLLSGSVAAWMFINQRIAHSPSSGGKLIEAVVGNPKGINPLYASANDPDADLTALVFSGLFRRKNGTLINDLADSYSWSSDAKVLTVTLKNNIFFHDGTPLTSEDVVFTLESAKNPAWRSPHSGEFRDASFSAPDERTVVISLGQPDATFLEALTIGILPAHLWGDIQPQNAQLADANIRPIGAGPFMASDFRRGSSGTILSYLLKRFNGYRNEKPLLDEVEFRYYPDRTAAEDAVRGGQADAVAFVPAFDVKKFPSSAFTMTSIDLPEESVAFLNVTDPILKDSHVREALAMSVDREDIVNAQNGFAVPVGGPFPSDPPPLMASSTEERLAAARKKLDDAGWTLAEGADIRLKTSVAKSTSTAVSTSSTPAFALTISVPDVPELIAIANTLAQRWSLLNARVTVKTEPTGTLLTQATRDRNLQIVLWNVLLPPSENQYQIWWSGQADGNGLNLSNLKDRDVDEAIKDMGSASSTDALATAKKKLTTAINARTPAIFLTQPHTTYAFSTRIRGVSEKMTLSTPSDRFTNLSQWYVKTAWGLR